MRIQRTLTRIDNGKRLALGEPKTKKSCRTIRLTEVAADSLKGHLERQLREIEVLGDRYIDQGLVFTTAAGTPINPSYIRRRSLAALLKRAGLPHSRLHDLRHLATVKGRTPQVRTGAPRARHDSDHAGHRLPLHTEHGKSGTLALRAPVVKTTG